MTAWIHLFIYILYTLKYIIFWNTLVVCAFIRLRAIRSVCGWLCAYPLPVLCSGGLRSWERHEFMKQGCVSPQPHRCTHSSEGLGSLAPAHFKTIYQWISESKWVQSCQWIKCAYMHGELCSTMSQGHCRNWRKYLWLPLVLFSTSYLSSPTFPPCIQTTASSSHGPGHNLLNIFCVPLFLQAVTKKTFGSDDFRSALENGMLLCE